MILAKAGFGTKRVQIALSARQHHFVSPVVGPNDWLRLAEVVPGRRPGRVRVHAVEPYKLALMRHGLERRVVKNVGWYDNHGPRAAAQSLPVGDISATECRAGGRGIVAYTRNEYRRRRRPGSISFMPQRRAAAIVRSRWWWRRRHRRAGSPCSLRRTPGQRITPSADAATILWRHGCWSYRSPVPRPICPGISQAIMASGSSTITIRFRSTDPSRTTGGTARTCDRSDRGSLGVSPGGGRVAGCWPGWSARALLTTSTPRRNCTTALSIWMPTTCLVLSTHPEYWSAEMYDRGQALGIRTGGKLMYLGGNGVNCPRRVSR